MSLVGNGNRRKSASRRNDENRPGYANTMTNPTTTGNFHRRPYPLGRDLHSREVYDANRAADWLARVKSEDFLGLTHGVFVWWMRRITDVEED